MTDSLEAQLLGLSTLLARFLEAEEPESRSQAMREAQTAINELAAPLGYWERIAKAMDTGGWVLELGDDDKGLVAEWAAEQRISIDTAVYRLCEAGYLQTIGDQKDA